MQASSPHKSEKYKGQDSSTSPTGLDEGVFSLCRGGVPKNGGFARIPGKTLRDTGLTTGGIITIYQFGNQVVVQTYIGVVIFSITELVPQQADYVVTNEGILVTTKDGLPIFA